MPANLLSLNDDILLLVVSYLSQPEALRFSLTVKEVYPIAIRQMPTIAGCQNAQHLTKIHAYMLSDIPNRAHRLVDLAIAHHRVESPATAILVKDLLTEAVNLRKLLLEPFTSLLNLEPHVGDALAALQRLQYIWLIEIWNEHCLSTFPRMRSNPSRIQLTENHNWGYSTFFSCLASFMNLRTLRFANVVEFSSESEPEPSGSWTKVPQVQCLILSDCVVPWSNFVDSLPNVRSVEIKEVTPAIEIGRKFWPDLRRLMLHESTDFRIVEAVCPVHWLVISVPLDEYDEDEKPDGEWELEPLNAVRAASPMVFCFTVSCSVDTAFLEHLIETGLQRLTLMDVNFLPDDDPDDPDGMEWLATNLSFLDLVPVVCLRAVDPPRTQWFLRPDEVIRKAVSTILQKTAPSLRYFAFALDDSSAMFNYQESDYMDECHQEDRFTWWQITGMEAAREVREIPTWQGERVRQYLLDVESITELDWDDALVAQTDVNWTSARAPLPATSSWRHR